MIHQKRGGARPNAGRHKKPANERRLQVSISLTPPVVEKLNREPSRSQFVETALVEKWARVEQQEEEL